MKFIEQLATSTNNGISLEESKGDRLPEIRATYELLTQILPEGDPPPRDSAAHPYR
ncbi:hypothetical protein ABZ636_31270 [Streptomyces sp. NPDC007251]|uniref:hypothetical protein n=1 Tax=Streptomyces sp. NPDC007251 TaxID=3154483 RepID=UPI0033CEC7B6